MQERGRSGTSTLGFRSSLAFAARANKGKSCCNTNVRFWQAMEKWLDAALGAVKTVGPAFVKFYNSLSDVQKARFNLLRSPSRPVG
jgi:hypothetical protein